MAGLTHALVALTDEDIALVKKAQQQRLWKALGYALGLVVFIFYVGNYMYRSGPMFLIVGMFLLMLVLDVGIMLKEYRDLARALGHGKKDIYSGVALATYRKQVRGYRNWGYDYYVVMKDVKQEIKQHKKKAHELGASFERTGNEAELEEYERMVETTPDNDHIRIRYEDFEKLKVGDELAFHCIKEVYLGSKIFKLAGTKDADEISYSNYFYLKMEVKH